MSCTTGNKEIEMSTENLMYLESLYYHTLLFFCIWCSIILLLLFITLLNDLMDEVNKHIISTKERKDELYK